jgi:hypothetical protein
MVAAFRRMSCFVKMISIRLSLADRWDKRDPVDRNPDYRCRTGWPDSANFRPSGDSLLWAF